MIGIIPACATPFVHDRADAGAMAANVTRWFDIGVHGVLVFGSTGEYVYVEEEERLPLLQAARAATPADRLLLVGCGAESTSIALRHLRQAADVGADAALVVTPVYYTRGNTDAQRRHFETLAAQSPLPVMIYNVPAFTAYDLPMPLILELARHPNIHGIKDSTSDLQRVALAAQAGVPNFAVFSGNPNLIMSALMLGAAGSITALANIVPELCLGVWEALAAGDHARAVRLQGAITQLHGAIGNRGIAGIKAVLAHRGFAAGAPRAPLAALPPELAGEVVAGWERAMTALA